MKKGLTELVFILDRSGSMGGLEADTIGGFNGMLEKQKREPGEAYVTTVLFDHMHERIHDRVDIQKIQPMTEEQYFVRGSTALLDALGNTIQHIGDIHRYARPEDVPEHTLFVITTDGMENASRHYTKETVKKMIEEEKEHYGWEFLFLGANMDAVSEAASLGIAPNRAVSYACSSEGTSLNYEVLDEAVSAVRASAPLSGNWSKRIQKNLERETTA